MKKNLLLIAATCGALFFTACNKNASTDIQIQGEPAYVNISLVDRQVGSKAPAGTEVGTDAENKVSVLEFYVFNADGSADTEVGRIDAATPGNGYLRIAAADVALKQKIRVSAGSNKVFFVVANMELGAPTASTLNTAAKVKNALSKAEFKATLGASDQNSRTIPTAGFEMSGSATGNVVEASTTNQVYITIARLVSKINAPTFPVNTPVVLNQEQINEIWNGLGVTPSSTITFQFTGYAVINGISKSNVLFSGRTDGNYIDPIGSPWSEWAANSAGKNYLVSTFDAAGNYTNNYSGIQNTSWFLDGNSANNGDRVYAFENRPASKILNGIVGFDPETVTSYIIAGKFSTTGQPDAVRYWRVDLIKADSYHIMRNCVYKVSINKISTPGFGTPKEAEEQPIIPGADQTMAEFVIKIANWDINTQETEM